MNIISLEEVDSTNLYAKQNLDSLEDRTIIVAKNQTSGRGRFNRSWVDLGDDNLFMSFVLKPSDTFKDVYANLTQYISVILVNILEEYGLAPSIKWPNDVLIDGKKISGILSETVMQGNKFKGLVLGVGVNLNAEKSALSLVKDKKITALNIELEREHVDKKLFFEKLVNQFFKSYDEFLEHGFLLIKNKYINACNFLGKEISVQVFDDKKSGIAKYINDSGELILQNHKKEEFVLTMGDIL